MDGVPIWEPKEITEAPGMDFSPFPKFSPGNPLLNKVEQSDRIAGTWRSRNRIRSKSAMRKTTLFDAMVKVWAFSDMFIVFVLFLRLPSGAFCKCVPLRVSRFRPKRLGDQVPQVLEILWRLVQVSSVAPPGPHDV